MKVQLPVRDLKKGGNTWGVDFLDWRKSYVSKRGGVDCISIVYKKGSNSTDEQMENGGIEIVFATPKVLPSSKSATFGCKIKYPDTFDFSRGGKTGVGFSMGKGTASGGRRSDNASSVRIMWRNDGAASLYVYVPKDLHQLDTRLDESAFDGGWGVEFFRDFFSTGTFKRGPWNDVTIKVTLNTFDSEGFPNPDGICIMSVNGKTASLGGVRWLKSPETIQTVPLNTFFGGEEWAASKDETVLYSGFWISDE